MNLTLRKPRPDRPPTPAGQNIRMMVKDKVHVLGDDKQERICTQDAETHSALTTFVQFQTVMGRLI